MGADPRAFFSAQIGSSIAANDILQTNGTNSTWVTIGSVGGAGGWERIFANDLTPTSTSAGIFVRASSTIDANFRITGNLNSSVAPVPAGFFTNLTAFNLEVTSQVLPGPLVVGGNATSTISGIRTTNTTFGAQGSFTPFTVAQSGNYATSTLSTGLTVATTTLVVNASEARVGVGTVSPNGSLHAYRTSGATTAIGRFEAAVASYTGTSLIAENTLAAASTFRLFEAATDSDGDAGGRTVQFVIRGDGNVGIGTTEPVTKLDINFVTTGTGDLIRLGNTTNGANLVLGTNGGASPSYGYITNTTGQINSPVIAITNAGNVGIGTTNPTSTLAVNGRIASSNGLLATSTTATVARFSNGNSTNDILELLDNNTPILNVKDGGNVGIGLTSPTAALHASSTATTIPVATFQGADNHTANLLQFRNNSTAFLSGFTASGGLLMNVSSTTALTLQNGSGTNVFVVPTNSATATTTLNTGFIADTADNTLVVNANENRVGVGTASPQASLHAYRTSGTTLPIGRFEAAIGSYTGTSLIADNTLGDSSTFNLFAARTDSDGDAGGPNTKFLIRGDGNVGIGDASPSALLSVGNGDLFTVTSAGQAIVNKTGSQITGQTSATERYDIGVATFTGSTANYMSVKSQTGIELGTSGDNIRMTLLTNGTIKFSSALGLGTGGNYLCIDTTTFEVLRGNGVACTASSARFKENIADLHYGLADVLKLRPISFSYKPETHLGEGLKLGFVAEDVQTIIPEVVTLDKDGKAFGVDYPTLLPVLTKAIQEQQAETEALKARVKFLEGNPQINILQTDNQTLKNQIKQEIIEELKTMPFKNKIRILF